jgi:D-xylose transport system substrate-binding protein
MIALTTRVAALAAGLAIGVLASAGCRGSGSSSSTDGGVTAEGESSKVAFLLSTLQEERYKKDQRYFEDAARRGGVASFTLSADNDNARQLAQVEDALSRHAKVLVIQPTDSAAAGAYVAKAHERGAKVVAYDRSIPGADVYVAHDSYSIGVLQAQAALQATGGRGNFVLLEGQSGHSVASEIARGYRETLKPAVDSGAVTVVVDKNHDAWSPEQALKTMEDAISKTNGNIQAVLANNSGMARGAVQAIQAAGLGARGIFIAGADADAANVNYVCEKKQSVEVFKDIKPLAEQALAVAVALLRGETVDAAPNASGVLVVAVPVVVINAVNVKSLLIDSGFHSASALPACSR